jgi:hypothetical protein
MCPGVGARSMVSWSAMNFGAGRASGRVLDESGGP